MFCLDGSQTLLKGFQNVLVLMYLWLDCHLSITHNKSFFTDAHYFSNLPLSFYMPLRGGDVPLTSFSNNENDMLFNK